MSFLKPLMLFGLLSALVPIIIHLIHKRRPRKQAFGAIEFVIRSVQRVQRRWRLKRFLLLAARVALLAALALGAARPLIGQSGEQLSSSSGPERIAVVIDASLSMRARPEDGRSAFEQAIKKARTIIQGMGPEDQMTLVLAQQKPLVLLPNLSASKPELLQALKQAKPSYSYVNIASAVSVAGQLLSSGSSKPEATPDEERQNRIVVLSDLAAHGFQQAAGLEGDVALNILDVFEDLEPEERNNYGITELGVQVVPGNQNNTVQSRIRIRSFLGAQESVDTSMGKSIDLIGPKGVVTEASVSVTPGNLTEKTLEHAFAVGGRFGISVQLDPDFLAEDDIRYAQVDVQDRVQSLIIDGAPSGLPKEDEIFYLERALSTGAKDQPPPRIIIADDIATEDLSKYRVVIMAGLSSLSAEDGRRISEFVERGGGLLITSTENLDVDQYNAVLGRVLPRALRGLKRRAALDERSKDDDSALLSGIDSKHPIMNVFTGDALDGLKTTRTQAYYLLQPNRNRNAKVIAAFEDGQPALIEAKIKKGRVILLTTSIDRDLSDLPIRPAFVPLMRHLLLYLSDALARPDERITFAGTQRMIFRPKDVAQLEVIGPNGKTTRLGELGQSESLAFEDTTEPGHYTVYSIRGAERTELSLENFSVNIDPRESDLSFLSPEEAIASLRGEDVENRKDASKDSALSFGSLSLSNPDRIAQMLLILMLLAFVFESFLTAERRRQTQDLGGRQQSRPWYRRILSR